MIRRIQHVRKDGNAIEISKWAVINRIDDILFTVAKAEREAREARKLLIITREQITKGVLEDVCGDDLRKVA